MSLASLRLGEKGNGVEALFALFVSLLLAACLNLSTAQSAWAEEGFGEIEPSASSLALSDDAMAVATPLAEVDMVGALEVEVDRDYTYAYEVLALVNKERATAGLQPLVMDKRLLDAAMLTRAVELSVYFSHDRPDGQNCFSVAPGVMFGENIAYGYVNPADVMDGWMNSAGHRANILDPDFKTIGIGCIYAGDYGPYWVQCFGTDDSVVSAAKPADTTVRQRVSVPRSWLIPSNFTFEYNYYSVYPGESDQAVVAFRNQSTSAPSAFCILPSNLFQWSSAKSSVATVNASGVITGKAPGATTVTAKLGSMVSLSVPVQVEGESGVWKKSGGKWWFQLSDGSYPYNTWCQIEGDWYHFDKSGYMQTGWLKVGGSWYYLKSSGAMATGWQKVGDYWYYLKGSGAMAKGWQKVGGSWYYLKSGGEMATGWQKVGGTWYYLKGSGAMATGWQKVGDYWYYLNPSGSMAAKKWIGDYYVDTSGAMATDCWVDGYYVGSDGKWVRNANASKTVYWVSSGEVYHLSKDCPSLSKSSGIQSGTISQSGKSRPCKVCG